MTAITASSKSRVIVVDDDKSVADTVTLVLRHAGFEVSTFYSALPAVQHALRFPPHVVVTDYSMPSMNGLQFVAWLKANCPGCKIVMVSGNSAEVEQEANADRSCFTLLQKPVPPDVLLAAIL